MAAKDGMYLSDVRVFVGVMQEAGFKDDILGAEVAAENYLVYFPGLSPGELSQPALDKLRASGWDWDEEEKSWTHYI